MKRSIKKAVGFMLSLALCAQLFAGAGFGSYGIEAAEITEAAVFAPEEAQEQGAQDNGNYEDVYEYSYDDYEKVEQQVFNAPNDYSQSTDWYTIDSQGTLTSLSYLPEDGKLPEGIKKINWSFGPIVNAKTVIYPKGLETLYLEGTMTKVSLPSTLKEITIGVLSGIEKLELPEGIESIKFDMESYDYDDLESNLKAVVIPKSVKNINFSVFNGVTLSGKTTETTSDGCIYLNNELIYVPKTLTEVKVKKGTKSLGNRVLSSNYYVTSVEIPDSVTSIGEFAFAGTGSLKSLKLPKNLETLGEGAFFLAGIENIEIPKGVKVIQESTFNAAKGLKTVKFLGNPTEIGYGAFRQASSLTSIEIPASVKKIDGYAFEDTVKLSKVTLNKGLETIEYDAFSGSGFKSINIPSTVKEIGRNCFSGTNGNVTVDKNNKYFKTYKNGIYTADYSRLIAYPKNLSKIEINSKCKTYDSGLFSETSFTSVSLPDGITQISDSGFWGSNKLKSVSIGAGVEEISEWSPIFKNCTSLKSIKVSEKNANYSSYKNCLYNKDKTKLIAIPEGQTKVTVHKKTTSIQYNILSDSYYNLKKNGRIEITLSKGITDMEPLGKHSNAVKLKVNVGSKSAAAIEDWNKYHTNVDKSKEMDNWGHSGYLQYSFIESDKAILNAIKQSSSKVSVAVGGKVKAGYKLPSGLVLVKKLSQNTNTKCSVTWSSKNAKVASVDKDGNVKGVKKGSTKITATFMLKSGTKRTITYDVTVS